MRSLTLSTTNSARWDRLDGDGAAYRRSVIADAHRGAIQLGETIEVYHCDGTLLEALPPEPCPAQHACPYCGRHPSTHAPGGESACAACGLGDTLAERDADAEDEQPASLPEGLGGARRCP